MLSIPSKIKKKRKNNEQHYSPRQLQKENTRTSKTKSNLIDKFNEATVNQRSIKERHFVKTMRCSRKTHVIEEEADVGSREPGVAQTGNFAGSGVPPEPAVQDVEAGRDFNLDHSRAAGAFA